MSIHDSHEHDSACTTWNNLPGSVRKILPSYWLCICLMKLRVREGRVTHKIEVRDDVTYFQLKEKVGTFVGTDPSGVRLSLNKQAELAGGDQDKPVKTGGVKGGDLLWLLSPSDSASLNQATSTQPILGHEAKHQRIAGSPSNSDRDRRPGAEGACVRESETASKELLDQTLSPEDCMEASRSGTQPAELPQIRPALSLSDYFALVREANSNRAHVLVCALHAAFLEVGWLPKWAEQAEGHISSEALQLPAASGKLMRLRYRYSSGSGNAMCEVVASLLGNYVMISAKLPDGEPHSLKLDGREYLATKDLSGISKIQSVSKERELLIQISNGLLRALMADLRSLLGLSPPAGFMSLPLDLADKILGYLPVEDLAALMGTCKEMRALAATDLHWERLATAEFNLCEDDVINAQRHGWLWMYKSKHLSREAARQRIREMQDRNRRPHPFMPMQPGPFRRPAGPYHQIGGDYDRNPLFQGPTWRPFINSPGGQGGLWQFRGSGI